MFELLMLLLKGFLCLLESRICTLNGLFELLDHDLQSGLRKRNEYPVSFSQPHMQIVAICCMRQSLWPLQADCRCHLRHELAPFSDILVFVFLVHLVLHARKWIRAAMAKPLPRSDSLVNFQTAHPGEQL